MASNSPFINAHTHFPKENEVSLFVGDGRGVGNADYFVFGLHPWDAEKVERNSILASIEGILSHPKCMGLGEVGLDRRSRIPFESQKKIFEEQLKIGAPLVVIHCVKAFSDIFPYLNQNQKYLFHDFNGNFRELEKILTFNSYFSFGKCLWREESRGRKSFSEISLDRIFFETDDQEDLSIEEVYERGAEILGQSIDDLKERIEKNFKQLF